MTTKGLRHVQIRENAVREKQAEGFCQVKHIAGKLNISDIFTKEDKDTKHFLTIRDAIMTREPEVIAQAKRIKIRLNTRSVTLGDACSDDTILSLLRFYMCSYLLDIRRINNDPRYTSHNTTICHQARSLSMRGVEFSLGYEPRLNLT